MDYKKSLNLPNTEFPMKARLAMREPEILALWEDRRDFRRLRDLRKGSQSYILHDGPPYADGDVHVGTALNKITKDFIIRFQSMTGKDATYVPGWDCHGLPIELMVLKKMGSKAKSADASLIRKLCREYAEQRIEAHKKDFIRLGIWGHWSRPYLTMSRDYETTIVRSFWKLYKKGLIYRGLRPVQWCPSCRTALADAEVEYRDIPGSSLTLKFPVVSGPDFLKGASFAVWTTTPWTLPANVGVAIHPDETYVLVKTDSGPIVVADRLWDGPTESRINTFRGSQILESSPPRLSHPFLDREVALVSASFITMDQGTGLVHLAPGHGLDDFYIGQKEGLETLCPVDDRGRFTSEAGDLEGIPVLKANEKIISKLKSKGNLISMSEQSHSYPHCWRCKGPLIYRATDQWFLSLDKNDLRERCISGLNNVVFYPAWGKDRLSSMVRGRPDWVLSRQRKWGVPIPMILCDSCDQVLDQTGVDEKIEAFILKHGVDDWFNEPAESIVEGITCSCGGKKFTTEKDILDVWFDSGVSHEAVLNANPDLSFPADLYLEGTDQHRGWFQVSLITSIALRDEVPYRGVYTHGFTVDGEGKKLSKSVGNFTSSADAVRQYGADVVRLWVASENTHTEVSWSPASMDRVAEAYRKFRNTLRYLLGNLADFDPSKDLVPLDNLWMMDRFLLSRLATLVGRVGTEFQKHGYYKGASELRQFTVVDLSSFYMNGTKDRLYTENASSLSRRAAQTTLWVAYDALLRMLSPILVFTAEEAYQNGPHKNKDKFPSVHQLDWPQIEGLCATDEALEEKFKDVMKLRDEVFARLEELKAEGKNKSPLEARVCLGSIPKKMAGFLEQMKKELPDIFGVSEVLFQTNIENGRALESLGGLVLGVSPSPLKKCERCWKRTVSEASPNALCARCDEVLASL